MKTNRLLRAACIVLLLALGGKLAYSHNLWNIRGVEPSELYLRYEHADGIKASFIKDYRVNDTLTLDVTLLQATDSAGWIKLFYDFNNKETDEAQVALDKKREVLAFLPGQAISSKGITHNDIGVASFLNHYICIFHCHDINTKENINKAIIDKIFVSLKNQNNFIENEKDN